jgi:hypothetical protein
MEHDNTNDSGYGYNEDMLIVGDVMSPQAQQERRNSIREIMADESLTPLEKRRNIQSLMDGRRRSSSASHVSTGSGSTTTTTTIGEMARSAREAAAEYYYGNQSDNNKEDNFSQHSRISNSNHSSHSNLQLYNYNGETDSTCFTAMNDNEYYGYVDNDTQQRQQLQLHSGGSGGGGGGGGKATEELLLQSIDSMNAAGRKQRSSSMPLWSEDTSRAAAPLVAAISNTIWDEPINISRRMEKSRPPCPHYERNCTIISPCCGLAFGCRICHDDCPVLPMPFAKRPPLPPPPPVVISPDNGGAGGGVVPPGMTSSIVPGGKNMMMTGPQGGANMSQERILNWEAVERAKHKQEKRRSMPLSYDDYTGDEPHHEIDRFAIAEIICRLCYTRQSSKT